MNMAVRNGKLNHNNLEISMHDEYVHDVISMGTQNVDDFDSIFSSSSNKSEETKQKEEL